MANVKRYTETKLDKILRVGLDRMDQAVERVCAEAEAPQIHNKYKDHCIQDFVARMAIEYWNDKRLHDFLFGYHGAAAGSSFGCASGLIGMSAANRYRNNQMRSALDHFGMSIKAESVGIRYPGPLTDV